MEDCPVDSYRASLAQSDPAVFDAIRGEELRQRDGIELIPSENYTYPKFWRLSGPC